VRIPSFEEMPADNRDLAAVSVDFDRLEDDGPDSCPVPPAAILRYLAEEVPGGDRLGWSDLTFERTARVHDECFWIWRFCEPNGGSPAYVTVSSGPDGVVTGYDVDEYGLTAEQFILGTYHDVF